MICSSAMLVRMISLISATVVMIYLLIIRIKSRSNLLIFPTIQKPDRPSPVQDHERRGSGGLLSLLPMHAERRDGEDLLGGAMIWNGGAKPYEAAAARVDVCLTI